MFVKRTLMLSIILGQTVHKYTNIWFSTSINLKGENDSQGIQELSLRKTIWESNTFSDFRPYAYTQQVLNKVQELEDQKNPLNRTVNMWDRKAK